MCQKNPHLHLSHLSEENCGGLASWMIDQRETAAVKCLTDDPKFNFFLCVNDICADGRYGLRTMQVASVVTSLIVFFCRVKKICHHLSSSSVRCPPAHLPIPDFSPTFTASFFSPSSSIICRYFSLVFKK